MGVRYRNTFYSLAGVLWQIDVHDSTYSSTVNLFKTGAEGFTIPYKNVTERLDPIMASTAQIPVVVENSTIEDWITEMMTAQEERFSVKIYRNSSIEWVGVLLPDQVTREDVSYPYYTNLTFTDGFARLKDIEYKNGSNPYTGRVTLLEHILNCLSKTGVTDLYAAGDYYLATSVNYYEQHHQYTASKCPLAYTTLNHSIFFKYDKDGNVEYKKCYDVLEMILRRFNARIIMSNGHWRIVQPQGYTGFMFTRYFNKSGGLITYGSATYRLNPVTANRLAGGSWKYYPPINKISVKYNTKITNAEDNSFLPVQSKYDPTVSFLTDVYIDAAGSLTIFFSGTIHEWYNITAPGITPQLIFTKYGIKVIKTKLSDGSKEYLKGNSNSSNASVTTWTTNSNDYYEMWGFQKEGYSWHTWTPFQFQCPPISEDCSITFRISVINHYNYQLVPYTFGATEEWDYEVQEAKAISSYDYSEQNEEAIKFTTTNTTNGTLPVASTVTLEIPDTDIGDGPYNYSLGKLMASNGGAYSNTNFWGLGSQLGTKNINQLSIEQNLMGQRVPVEKYSGTFIFYANAHNALQWGSKVYVPIIFEVRPALDEISGEWFNCVIPVL